MYTRLMAPGSRWMQSYSGVRAEVGLGPEVDPSDAAFAFRHAYCYAVSRMQARPSEHARLVLARDPRPTGAAIARAQVAGLSSACRDLGVSLEITDLGIVTTPVWQHSVRLFEAHGGVMVTASHNPICDNGWKYATGVETFAVDPAPPGALLSAAEMGNLIRAANAFSPQPERSPQALSPDPAKRESALAKYVEFVRDAYAPKRAKGTVVLDPNGGAACGICERAFEALGIAPIIVNGNVGEPAHEIDVEQSRPDGTHVLDALAKQVRACSALFGLAYDFDADRGSLTFVVPTGEARIPSPQQASAINAAIALALHRRAGDPRMPAVVASDGTSVRVKRIAEAFGASLHEVETGEINVVTKMRDLEALGLAAVAGVEGPNGGTIFSGTTCRDGTLVGAGALLASADEDLRSIVAEALAPEAELTPGLGGFVEALPKQRTLAEKSTVSMDWQPFVELLESSWQAAFARRLSGDWDRYEISYSSTRTVSPERPLSSGYGWKARLFRAGAEGFLWLRGSRTETGVLRLIADAPNEERAQRLLAAGKALLREVSGDPS